MLLGRFAAATCALFNRSNQRGVLMSRIALVQFVTSSACDEWSGSVPGVRSLWLLAPAIVPEVVGDPCPRMIMGLL